MTAAQSDDSSRVASRPALTIAALASAAAGLVHAAAAGTHQGDAVLVWLFATWSALQLGWGWTLATSARHRRPLLLAGLVINGGAVVVWALSRTVGVGFVASLSGAERAGPQDVTAATFATISIGAIAWLLVGRPARSGSAPGWTGALAAGAFVLVLPALVAGHVHDEGEHIHGEVAATAHDHAAVATDDGHGHTAATSATAGHDHTTDTTTDTGAHAHTAAASTDASTDATDADASHDHSATTDSTMLHEPAPTTDTTPGHDHSTTTTTTLPHDHGGDDGTTEPPIISLDDPRLSQSQVDAAVALIVSTLGGMQGLTTVEAVEAAGYESVGDGGQPGEYTHYVNWSFMTDGYDLDSSHIESVTVKMNADGTTRVVAAMYSLTFGDDMDDVPEIAGSLTTWHDHDTFCFDGSGFVALAVGGACPAGALLDTPPMLHVWIEDNPCGPFADVEEDIDDCAAGHDH